MNEWMNDLAGFIEWMNQWKAMWKKRVSNGRKKCTKKKNIAKWNVWIKNSLKKISFVFKFLFLVHLK